MVKGWSGWSKHRRHPCTWKYSAKTRPIKGGRAKTPGKQYQEVEKDGDGAPVPRAPTRVQEDLEGWRGIQKRNRAAQGRGGEPQFRVRGEGGVNPRRGPRAGGEGQYEVKERDEVLGRGQKKGQTMAVMI